MQPLAKRVSKLYRIAEMQPAFRPAKSEEAEGQSLEVGSTFPYLCFG